tara:strand:+ start:54 stop:362 length:309 start_codon:yes stop_codon:yes gene_type:complete
MKLKKLLSLIGGIFLIISTSQTMAFTMNKFTIGSPNASFVIQPGDTCQSIGTYIQNNQCSGRIIKFIAATPSGSPTLCIWNDGWQNGQQPLVAGETGYYECG